MVEIPSARNIGYAGVRSGRAAPNGPAPVMGAAIANAGQGLVQSAFNLKTLADQEAQDTLKDKSNSVSTAMTRFLGDEEQNFLKAQDSSSESGIGFTRNYLEGWQKRADQFAKDNFGGLSKDEQTRYLNTLINRGNDLYAKSDAFESKQKGTYYQRTTNTSLDTVRTQIRANSAPFDQLKQQGIDAIQSADMPESWKAARLADWTADSKEAQWKWEFERNPRQAISDLQPSANSTTLIRKEEGFATEPYWDVNAWRIGYGSDTVTLADGSHAPVKPGMKITRDDAERDLQYRLSEREGAQARKQVGGGWANLPGNIQAGLESVAYNYGSLPDAVVTAAKSGDANAIADAVASLSSNSKRRQREADIIRGNAPVPVNDRYNDIPLDRRDTLANWGQAQYTKDVNQQKQTARGDIEIATANAPVAMQNTGTYQGEMPTPDKFNMAYGEVEGPQKYAAFKASMDVGQQAYRFQTMPESEINQAVKDATPRSSGTDAAVEDKSYDVLSKAAAQVLKAREADPASYTQKAFPNVAQAWSDASQSGDYRNALSLSAGAQASLGIQKPQLLPKAVAQSAVDTFKMPDISDADRIGAVNSLFFATSDPSQRRQIFDQLVGAGLPAMMEGAIEAASRGDSGASNRLMQAALTDTAKLPKSGEVKSSEIDSTIYSSVWGPGQIGDAAYGLSYGDASSLERAQRGGDLLKKAVTLRVAQGEDVQTATDNASKDLFGDVSVYTGSGSVNANLPVPKDTDTSKLTSGLTSARTAFKAALEGQRDAILGNAKATGGGKAILENTTQNRIDDILDNGIFVPVGNGVGLRDPYTGQFVPGADGKTPLSLPLDQIMKMGEAVSGNAQNSGIAGRYDRAPTEITVTTPAGAGRAGRYDRAPVTTDGQDDNASREAPVIGGGFGQ